MRKLSIILAFLGYGMLTNKAFSSELKVYFNHNIQNKYLEPYRNFERPGDNLEQVLVDEINSAEKSVWIAVQELRLPGVAKALAEQKKRGLDVRVILENQYNKTVLNVGSGTGSSADGEGNEHDQERQEDLFQFIDKNKNGKISVAEMAERDAVYILQKAKVQIIDDTFDGSLGSSLMHHKFVVVDRKKVVISSANFTLSGVHGDFTRPKSLGNDNSMIVINSTEVANFFSTEFLIMWGGQGGSKASKFGVRKPFRGIQKTILDDNTEVQVIFSPTSLKRYWHDSTNGLIAKEIAKAKKSLSSALFVFSDQKISNALEKAHDKGVGIEVVAEPKFAFRDYSEVLDLFGIALLNSKCEFEPDNRPWKKPLQNVGIASKRGRDGDLLHHKYAVIDGKKVIFGSHNWSSSANHQNDEFLVVIENKKLAEAFTAEFDRLKLDSSMGVPSWLTRRAEETSDACRDIHF